MKKIIMCFVLIFAMLPISAFAASADLFNFESVKKNEGNETEPFTDVPTDAWYSESVNAGYAYGILTGYEGAFTPDDTLSGAEAVTIAAKINAIYLYGAEYESVLNQFNTADSEWYDKYLSYCKEHSLLGDEFDAAMLRPLNRAEMVHVWYKVIGDLPQDANKVISLPDVNSSVAYSSQIEAFYSAGIIRGGDTIGTFKPYDTISRAEAASIFINLIEPVRRSTGRTYEKPLDFTVYTSNKPLWWGEAEMYGLYTINGEYYLPLELFKLYGNESYGNDIIQYSDGSPMYFSWALSTGDSSSSYSPRALPQYTVLPPNEKAVGTAQQTTYVLKAPSYEYEDITGAIMTLGDRYPMVRLSALSKYVDVAVDSTGVYVTSEKVRLNYGDAPSREADKIGEMAQANIKDNVRDTLRSFHDALVNLLTYSYDANEITSSYNWYNNRTLDVGMGVCEDYTRAFYEMCVRAGIPCFYQGGWAKGAHAWNAVYLDGAWQYIDVTWDDPQGTSPTLRWDYFLIDGNALMKDHFWAGLDYSIKESYNPAWEDIDPMNIKTEDEFRKCLLVQLYHRVTPIKLKGKYGGIEVAQMATGWGGMSCKSENGYWVINVQYY